MRNIIISCLILFAVASCGHDAERRYNNTIDGLKQDRNSPLAWKRKCADATIDYLTKAGTTAKLEKPMITYSRCMLNIKDLKGNTINILIVVWVAEKPDADGILVRSKKGEINLAFDQNDIAANDFYSKDSLAYESICRFDYEKLIPLLYEKDIKVALTKNGSQVSNEYAFEIEGAPHVK